MPLPSSPPLPPLLLPLLCFYWAMGSAPANPNPPMAVTSATPLLPVVGEQHLSSLSLSSTSSRTFPLSLTQRADKGQPRRCGNDPCDGGIDRGFPSAFSYVTLGAIHPTWPSLRAYDNPNDRSPILCVVFILKNGWTI